MAMVTRFVLETRLRLKVTAGSVSTSWFVYLWYHVWM